MAAHTLSRKQSSFNDRLFFEIMDISLIDAYLAVSLISWRKLTVCHAIVIERILADEYLERAELLPSAILVSGHSDSKNPTYIRLGKLMPFLYIETGITAFGFERIAIAIAYHSKYFGIFLREIKIQRCYSCRNSHTDVIRKYLWQFFTRHNLLAAGDQCKTNCRERCQYTCFHF